MTGKEHVKVELMVYAIKHDYFGYGSECYRKSNGQWVSIVDGEKTICSGKQLASDFDTLDFDTKEDIVKDYFRYEIIGVPHEKPYI